ncbi:MAG: DHH family phosphoesterase [Thermoguttaceae bacterium]|jgi:phosphoesterase RecJ-like protein
MPDWSKFVDIVRRHQRFALTSHIRPDGDALGCETAMAEVLESLGKDVIVCNVYSIPPDLQFIDPKKRFKKLGADLAPDRLADREVLIILDTSAWAQLGSMADVIRSTKALKVVVDHHVSQDDLGAEVFKDVDAEATGRLVIDAMDQLKVPLTPDIARAAFVAVATDTGWFRFASTRAGTFTLIARLVQAGADPDEIYKNLYENDSLARLRLIGRTLSRVQTELDGRLIHTYIANEDFSATGALPSDSEDIINLTLAVGGAQVAVILVEQPKGGFKVSLRSRSRLDCAALAENFGGGGHKKAAGLSIDGTLESAQTKVLDAVRAAMNLP